ncbi:MAG: hypothetical protein ACREDO_09115 [Methyloceanibacter sp.]
MLGSDDKTHLAYELVLLNIGKTKFKVDKVETLDAETGAVLGSVEGSALLRLMPALGDAKEAALGAGVTTLLFMDVTLDKSAEIPKALTQRYTLVVDPAAGSDDAPQNQSFVSDPLPVGASAVVVAPPLKGKGWVVGNGCCAPPIAHRVATLPINGAFRVAERFAIDFVQLDDKNAMMSGPKDKLESYSYFGDEIYSVADGTVVAIKDDEPEQVPGKLPANANIQMAGGNMWSSISAMAASPCTFTCSPEASR